MTRCHRKHLERICRLRGRELAEVMPCVVAQEGDLWTIDTDHPAYPRKPWKPVQVGDLLERGLKRIGITKERVEAITGTKGRPGGCGCQRRQQWLNQAGEDVQLAARRAAISARRFLLGD